MRKPAALAGLILALSATCAHGGSESLLHPGHAHGDND